MAAEQDFAAYAAARWPGLVRVLVLVGCPEPLAPEVALDGLAQCYRRWERIRREEDVEAAVHGAVLDAWARRRRGPWWEGVPPREVPAEVDAVLDRLPVDGRAALVLQEVGGLDPLQVAAALDLTETPREVRPPAALPDLREVDLDVGPVPPVFRFRAAARAAGRESAARATRVAGAVAVTVALLVGAAWWLAVRGPGASPGPPAEPLGRAPTERAANPVGVAWYAAGVLHLPAVRVELPSVVDLGAVPGGAVYADRSGRVVHVREDGSRTGLGRTDPGSELVVSAEEGWASWREAGSGDLVLRDVFSGEEVGRVPGSDLAPVAVDEGRLYYTDPSGSYRLSPRDGADGPVGESRLLDARAGRLAFAAGAGAVRVVRPLLDQVLVRPGEEALLQHDGGVVLTRIRGAGREAWEAGGEVRLFDTFSGAELPSGLAPDEVALAATFGPERSVVYVVARPADLPDERRHGRLPLYRDLELRTCLPRAARCTSGPRLPSIGATAVLAR